MMTLTAFLIAIALLVAVHEWGHFAMARACGVKVLQFSIGFGPRLFGWTSARSGTEYRVGMLPLGGFVKMLDEREGPVDEKERDRAFNRQPLKSRAAIVAAGPAANLVLALLLYTGVNWIGIADADAIVSRPPAQSLAAEAGFVGGEKILRAGFDDASLEEVRSFEDFRWWLTRAALDGQSLQLEYMAMGSDAPRSTLLTFDNVDTRHADASLFRAIGFTVPLSPALVGNVTTDSPAMQAGLQPGDLVREVDGVPIVDSAQLRELIRQSGLKAAPAQQRWLVQRDGVSLDVLVTPKRELEAGQAFGRVGAMIGGMPAMKTVRYGFVEGINKAASKTWEVSALTLNMIGQMVIGAVSVRNLSGPLTIADYAGKSAALGVQQFMVFLALISISLGVLNLLPLPVLDGGHLMYYVWEGLTGRAVSEAWLSRLQRAGLAMLLLMMSVALFNDLTRLLS